MSPGGRHQSDLAYQVTFIQNNTILFFSRLAWQHLQCIHTGSSRARLVEHFEIISKHTDSLRCGNISSKKMSSTYKLQGTTIHTCPTEK